MQFRHAVRLVMLFVLLAMIPVLIGNWLLDEPIQRWEASLPNQRLVKVTVAISILTFGGLLALTTLGDEPATGEPAAESPDPVCDPRLTLAGREAWFQARGEFGYPIHWKGWALLALFLASVGAIAWARFPVERYLNPAIVEKGWVILVMVDVAWVYWMVRRHMRPRRSRAP